MKILTIIIFTIFSRFLFIGKIPQMVNSSLWQRYLNASVSVGSVFIIYFLVKTYFKSQRIALLSALIFSILPWSLEQGRIVSPVNMSLFFLLIVIFLAEWIKRPVLSVIAYLLMPLVLYFFYPQFWLFKVKYFSLSLSNFISNLFILVSPDFLFFKNPTFWWGGVRETGIVYLAFLPFLLLGIYELLVRSKYNIFVGMGVLLLISSLSPFFPESREFYFITPFLSIILAVGINKFYQIYIRKNLFWKTIFIFIFMFSIYELSQFFHYYMVHYPQQIRSGIENINEAF